MRRIRPSTTSCERRFLDDSAPLSFRRVDPSSSPKRNAPIVDVVVDPIISTKLREHQRTYVVPLSCARLGFLLIDSERRLQWRRILIRGDSGFEADSHMPSILTTEGYCRQCVMGMRSSGQGCILADDMGLGKTIQSIALIWTLLSE